ncbi:hypothetical protein Efla_003749 [Eimeria flavescens]
MKLQLVLCAILAVASAIQIQALDSTAVDSSSESHSTESARVEGENASDAGAAPTRRSLFRRFSELAPRQKVVGVVNAIALLRTKMTLIEEMKAAFEPRNSKSSSAGVYAGHPLPGPALAYTDCRLGLLSFEICRHLGFLESDPMVAPSSTQSKMLTLLGASSLVASLKAGQLYLKGDPDLKSTLSPELIEAAVRALGACWNAQLLFPAFDARPSSADLMAEAAYHADTFLFLTAMQAKKILRFARSDYEDVGNWLASIFSDLQAAETMSKIVSPREGTAHKTGIASVEKEEKPSKLPEKTETKSNGPKAEPQPAERPQPKDNTKVPESAETKAARPQEEASTNGIIGGFLSRFFPSQTQQTANAQEGEQQAAPANVLSAIANSVGGLTSIVTGANYNSPKPPSVEVPVGPDNDINAAADTEKKLGGILDTLPEEVEGQF